MNQRWKHGSCWGQRLVLGSSTRQVDKKAKLEKKKTERILTSSIFLRCPRVVWRVVERAARNPIQAARPERRGSADLAPVKLFVSRTETSHWTSLQARWSPQQGLRSDRRASPPPPRRAYTINPWEGICRRLLVAVVPVSAKLRSPADRVNLNGLWGPPRPASMRVHCRCLRREDQPERNLRRIQGLHMVPYLCEIVCQSDDPRCVCQTAWRHDQDWTRLNSG